MVRGGGRRWALCRRVVSEGGGKGSQGLEAGGRRA